MTPVIHSGLFAGHFASGLLLPRLMLHLWLLHFQSSECGGYETNTLCSRGMADYVKFNLNVCYVKVNDRALVDISFITTV